MSQENVEIVRRGYEAFQPRRHRSRSSSLRRIRVRHVAAVGFNVHRDIYDLDQFGRVFDELEGASGGLPAWADEFLDAGDDVVVPFTNRVRGSDGIELQGRGAFVWTIRDGPVVGAASTKSASEALEAAGLSE